uniref:KASH domain-containing protein n=1 Tax=Callorhinchus milii TaxID=7868 RepID=A0A4W3IEI9_CALMI
MTLQVEEEFETSLENARAWMHWIQEQVEANDSILGPRSALEARLKASENILKEEPEGKLKLQMVLLKAESLLHNRKGDKKHEIQAALKEIKTMWEETTISMIHCHSRIEWVLLHWSEYLKAEGEYFSWFLNMKQKLEPNLELQLDLKEKQLQLSHHRILLSNIHNQSALLQRLAQERGSLFEKTKDPTLHEDIQRKVNAEHQELQRQEKVNVLEAITEEHEQYQESLDKFQNWLNSISEKYDGITTKDYTGSIEEILKGLRVLSSKEEDLLQLEHNGKAVTGNTSPLGAEHITRELEELREKWERLRLSCTQDKEALLQSQQEFTSRAQQLEKNVAEFNNLVHKVEVETLNVDDTNDELETTWRKYVVSEVTRSWFTQPPQAPILIHFMGNITIITLHYSLSQSEEFAATYQLLQERLSAVKVQLMANRKLQPSLETKRQQVEQLQVIMLVLAVNSFELLFNQLLTAELTEKEIQLHQIEVQAETVLKNTSPDGRKYIQDEVEHLQRMWTELNKHFRYTLSPFSLSLIVKGQVRNDYHQLRKMFEEWLKTENRKLMRFLSGNISQSTKEIKSKKQGLKSLRSRVTQGQKLFEQLIDVAPVFSNTEDKQLEDLRYRWMLYKSKLSTAEAFTVSIKSSGGMCRYLYRACCAALPLQLFLLFLLLLAFLLPLIQEQDSCSLVNNFARSFYLMLRYQGPPPT